MKKVLAFFTAAVLLLTLTACSGLKSDGKSDGVQSGSSQNDDPVIQIDGETIKLTYETHHRDLYFKENLTMLYSDTMGSVSMLTYRRDGDAVFAIFLVYYENKSIEEVMSESDNTLTEKTINGLSYQYFEYDNNGTPGHTYLYCYDGTTYAISFVSALDMSSPENVFLSNVRFAKE